MENLIFAIKSSEDNILNMIKEGRNGLNKVSNEFHFFHIKLNKQNKLDIYYDNNIIPMAVIFPEEHQSAIIPLMIFYTLLEYYSTAAKNFTDDDTYAMLCKEAKKVGIAIRNYCFTTEFTICPIQKEQVMQVKTYVEQAIPQLHHISNKIGDHISIIVPEESEALKEIRSQYEAFKVGYKYIYYYDRILKKSSRISIDSPQSAYAICMLLCNIYQESIPWLKKYKKDGQWCPLTPWFLYRDFQNLVQQIFL